MNSMEFRVKLSEAVQCILQLDDERNAQERRVRDAGRGWYVGDRDGWVKVLEELDGVAEGYLYDASDNPGATKRAAKSGAQKIRKALEVKAAS